MCKDLHTLVLDNFSTFCILPLSQDLFRGTYSTPFPYPSLYSSDIDMVLFLLLLKLEIFFSFSYLSLNNRTFMEYA